MHREAKECYPSDEPHCVVCTQSCQRIIRVCEAVGIKFLLFWSVDKVLFRSSVQLQCCTVRDEQVSRFVSDYMYADYKKLSVEHPLVQSTMYQWQGFNNDYITTVKQRGAREPPVRSCFVITCYQDSGYILTGGWMPGFDPPLEQWSTPSGKVPTWGWGSVSDNLQLKLIAV